MVPAPREESAAPSKMRVALRLVALDDLNIDTEELKADSGGLFLQDVQGVWAPHWFSAQLFCEHKLL